MPLAVTLPAAVLTLVGTAAALHGYRDNRLAALVSACLGAVMLCILFVPGFTGPQAAAASLLLLLPVGATLAVPRWRAAVGPRGDRGRLTLALTLADIEFMAIAMFLMPAAGAMGPMRAADRMSGMHGMTGAMPPGAAAVTAALLLGWAACAAILIIPLARGKGRRHGAWHAVCSGTMIAAMAVMM